MLVSSGNTLWNKVSQIAWWKLLLVIFCSINPCYVIAQVSTQPPKVPFEQAVFETLEWSTGNSSAATSKRLYEQIELSSFRYGIEPEFSICVIAAENVLYPEISWVRYESWAYIERTTGNKRQSFPRVTADLDTALSELRGIMKTNDSTKDSYVSDVLIEYWSGSKGEFNLGTVDKFVELGTKLFDNGFKPYLIERGKEQNRNKYGSGRAKPPNPKSAWAGLAIGDMAGYKSSMNSMPSSSA